MKLVIINGPSGIGKSTLAAKLHEDMPLSLLIDVDAWRRQISHYREKKEESAKLAYKITIAATREYLASGNSVIIEKAILKDDAVLDELVAAGKKADAEVNECILTIDKDTLMQRAAERGFRPGSLLTPEKVEELWHASQRIIAERTEAHVIDMTGQGIDETYIKLRQITG